MMNYLNIFTFFYSWLHPYRHVPNRILSPIRFVLRKMSKSILPLYLKEKKVIKYKTECPDIIISFTSFPGRINNVWLVVSCLKRQRVKVGKIILWLSKKQFPQGKDIPQSLRDQIDDQFEIRLVEGDIRSHKKYYYAMKEFPEKTIVTVDDDIFYHPDTILRLIETSAKFPNAIIANETSKLTYTNGSLNQYREWIRGNAAFDKENLVQIGEGGCLYPPHSLHSLVLDKDVFMDVAPLADDLWLNAMARMVNTPIVQSRSKILLLEIDMNAPSLCEVNNGAGKNDQQLKAIREYLKNHYDMDPYE